MMKPLSGAKHSALFVRVATFAIVFSAAVLAACGWHLQGASRLPESLLKIRIDTVDTYTDFYRELRQDLLASGAQLDPPTRDAAVVRVQVDRAGQRVLSISARNTPEEYEVFYAIEYSVDVAGVEVQPRERLELTSNYSFDPTAVLAKERERGIMQKALARELAGLVLRRLGSINKVATQAQVGSAPEIAH